MSKTRKTIIYLLSILIIVFSAFCLLTISNKKAYAESSKTIYNAEIVSLKTKVSGTKIRFDVATTPFYGKTYSGNVTLADGTRTPVTLQDDGTDGAYRMISFVFSSASSPDFFITPDDFVCTTDSSVVLRFTTYGRYRYAAGTYVAAPNTYTATTFTAASKSANDSASIFGNSTTRYYGLLETGMVGTNNSSEVFYGSVYDVDNDKYVPVKVQEMGAESSKRLVRFFFGDRTVNNFIIDSTAKFLYAKDGTFKAFGVDRSYKVSFTSNGNPCTVVNAYTLTVNNGSGSGVYGDGESVTVVANVPSGYRFVKWVDGSNNQLSTDISYTFNVSSNLTLTAVTEQVVSYTITVTNGTGSGSYEEGASVTVTPTIPNGYKFIKWVDGNGTEVSTSSTYVFNASANITLTAILEVTTPSITLGTGNYATDLDSANPNSRVDISFLNSTWNSSYEPAITYTGYGYDINGNSVAVEVQKRVTSNSKFRVDLLFVKTNNPIIIKGGDVFTQKTVTANAPEQITFDKDYYIAFTIGSTPTATEAIYVDVTNGTGGGYFAKGTSVTVNPTVESGYKFVKWVYTASGNLASNSPSFTFTANSSQALTAITDVFVSSVVSFGTKNWVTPADSKYDISWLSSSMTGDITSKATYTGIAYDKNGNQVPLTVLVGVNKWTSSSDFRLDLKFDNTVTELVIKSSNVFTITATTSGAADTITFDGDYYITFVSSSSNIVVDDLAQTTVVNGSASAMYCAEGDTLTLTYSGVCPSDYKVVWRNSSDAIVGYGTEFNYTASTSDTITATIVAKTSAVVTIGTGRWASDLNDYKTQLSFNDCIISGSFTGFGTYFGIGKDSSNNNINVTLITSGVNPNVVLQFTGNGAYVNPLIIMKTSIFEILSPVSGAPDKLTFKIDYQFDFTINSNVVSKKEYGAQQTHTAELNLFDTARRNIYKDTGNNQLFVGLLGQMTTTGMNYNVSTFVGSVKDFSGKTWVANVIYGGSGGKNINIVIPKVNENYIENGFVISKDTEFILDSYVLKFDYEYIVRFGDYNNENHTYGSAYVTLAKLLVMESGASIRMGDVNGLRYTAEISKDAFDYITVEKGYEAKFGFIIMPFDYISTYGDLTVANLFENGTYYSENGIVTSKSAIYDSDSKKIIDLYCKFNETKTTLNNYYICGSISNILNQNLERNFIGRAYVELTKGDETIYLLAEYNSFNIENSKRNIMDIATIAYEEDASSFTSEQLQIINDLYLVHKTENDENIISNSASDYSILVSSSATDNEIFAANELQNYIKESTGVILNIVSDSGVSYSKIRKYISIGNTTFLKSVDVALDYNTLGDSGYVITTATSGSKTLYIVGYSDFGTLMGVYGWLEGVINLEYYGASSEGLNKFDNVETITLSQYTGITYKPSFETRLVTYREARFDDSVPAYKDEATSRLKEYAGDWFFLNGMSFHNSFIILPSSTYYASHHDWYYYANGNAQQLCYSNTSMRTQYIANLKTQINAWESASKSTDLTVSQKVVVLGMEDNAYWCNCSECSKKVPTDLMVEFGNYVENEINAWRTHNGKDKLTFLIFAYYNTLPAPSNDVEMNDNLGVMYAPIKANFRASLRGTTYETELAKWANKTDNLYVWSYNFYTNQTFVMYDTFSSMQDNYKLFIEYGVKGIYDQTESFMTVSTGYGRLKEYVQSKLMWNVNENVNTLIDDWFDAYFGEASNDMKAIFDHTRSCYSKVYSYGNLAYATAYQQADSNYSSDIGQVFTNPSDNGFHCIAYYKNAFSKGEYRDQFKANLVSWLNTMNNLMTTYSSNSELVTKIKIETIQYRYLYIELFDEGDGITKTAFKSDVTALGITHYAEGKTVGSLWASWGI